MPKNSQEKSDNYLNVNNNIINTEYDQENTSNNINLTFSDNLYFPNKDLEDEKSIDNKITNIFTIYFSDNEINKDIIKIICGENQNKEKIFDIKKDPKINLFTEFNEIKLLGKKRTRSNTKTRRMNNKDNINRKIKRGFFNQALIQKLNETLKSSGSTLYLEKFPKSFVSDITKKTNKELLYMTLENTFEKKELYKQDDIVNYKHNLEVIKNEKIQKNKDLKNILNTKICTLFEEYINSYEFNVIQIQKLEKNKVEYKDYYIYLSRHFIEMFS